ncbi:hypothetical protein Y032_0333g2805 [Ancylostoma ceylanicum]|uniref:Uncharacterized protein n=1 Tax=Ancylostoma ceylanicum TaxID=53326 RepID=A0A016RZS8_9BILA|nr:hypothetical protein Y032_0333g2805 [Ancylostoma ceylanicum]
MNFCWSQFEIFWDCIEKLVEQCSKINFHKPTLIDDASSRTMIRDSFELCDKLQIVCEIASVQCKIKAIDSRILKLKETLKGDAGVCRAVLQVLHS